MGLLNEEIIDMDRHSVSDIIQRGSVFHSRNRKMYGIQDGRRTEKRVQISAASMALTGLL